MIEPSEILEHDRPATTSSMFHDVLLNTRIMPAERALHGGDWCETFAVSRDVVALSIGDICGHGAQKYIVMDQVRQSIRQAAGRGLDTTETLAAANRFLRRYDPDENATAIFALFNARERSLVFSNAGHPPPLVAGPFGALFLEYADADLPLGIMPEIAPASHVVSIPARTLLVLYTDGVSERGRAPIEGAAQLREAGRLAYAVSHLAAPDVIERQMFLMGSNADDAAILTARTLGAPILRGAATRFERAERLRLLDGRDAVRAV